MRLCATGMTNFSLLINGIMENLMSMEPGFASKGGVIL